MPWTTPHSHPALLPGHAHVWRIPLPGQSDAINGLPVRPNPRINGWSDAQIDAHAALLSADETSRAGRFFFRTHAVRYTVAHGVMRVLLAGYANQHPGELEFVNGAHGKPEIALREATGLHRLHFNLSHSANLALLAVSTTGPIGVDVEWWRPRIQHLAVAERFFSKTESTFLRGLTDPALVQAFFRVWSRKEAYLKATGYGISRGLHHFDVSADSAGTAEILQDRLDSSARSRWVMANIEAGPDYSAALVASLPLTTVHLYDALNHELFT